MNKKESKSSHTKKIAIRVVVFSAIVAITVFLFFKFSPWPSALLIRHAFEKDAKQTNERLENMCPMEFRKCWMFNPTFRMQMQSSIFIIPHQLIQYFL